MRLFLWVPLPIYRVVVLRSLIRIVPGTRVVSPVSATEGLPGLWSFTTGASIATLGTPKILMKLPNSTPAWSHANGRRIVTRCPQFTLWVAARAVWTLAGRRVQLLMIIVLPYLLHSLKWWFVFPKPRVVLVYRLMARFVKW